MGYARNSATVRKHYEELAPLLAFRTFVWQKDDPAAWAYKVRECLNIAVKKREDFPGLARVGDLFKKGELQIVTAGKSVIARFLLVEPPGHTAITLPESQTIVEDKSAFDVLDNPPAVVTVVDYWLRVVPRTKPILLTNCQFTNTELDQLEKWAMSEGWRVKVEEGKVVLESK